MQIPKLTEQDKARFRALVPDDPRVTIRAMFANLGAYVNDNMFAGTFGPDIGVKLNETDRAALLQAGATSFGPPQRPMGGYLTIPSDDDTVIRGWMERALTHVATLPEKRPKKISQARGNGP